MSLLSKHWTPNACFTQAPSWVKKYLSGVKHSVSTKIITIEPMVLAAQSCRTLCNPMDCSLPGSSVHGSLWARTLGWVAIPFSRGSSQRRDQIQVSHMCRKILYHLNHQGGPYTIDTMYKIDGLSRWLSSKESNCNTGATGDAGSIQSLDQEDPLEDGMTTHSSILFWTIPWIEKAASLQSIRSQRVGHHWSDLAYTHARAHTHINI